MRGETALRACGRALHGGAVLAVALLLASCSAVHEHQLTPWCKLESRRPTLQIVHVWEGTTEDRLLVRDGAGWAEALRGPQRSLLTTVVLASGAGVAANPGRGWLVFRPGATSPVALPGEPCGVVAGHPSRPTVLCLGPAGAPDALVPAFDGPRLLELGLDGAVLGEASLEAPKARVRNAVIGGVQEDGAVLVLATLLLREQRSECLLYALAPGRSSLLARWPAAPMPAIECPWSAKAEAAAKGEVTRAIGPARFY